MVEVVSSTWKAVPSWWLTVPRLSRGVTQASLRRLMVGALEAAILFGSSLDYNIRYGKRNCSTEERDDAMRASQCFRESIGGGLGPVVGNRD